MENKKSFVLHVDSLDILNEMTDVQAGQLFKAIQSYQKGNEIELDLVVKMAFIPFRNQFLRDDEKWIDTKEKRALAGSKGGWQKVANANKSKQNNPVSDNVNISVNERVTVNEKESESVSVTPSPPPSSFSFSQFWNLYNKRIGITQCETLWEAITSEEKLLIAQRLPAYIEATESEVMYRKDPFTWLSGKHWLDEHVPAVKKSVYDLLK